MDFESLDNPKAQKLQGFNGNDNVPRAGATFEYTEEHIREIVKCSRDIFYFAEKYFYILVRDEEGVKRVPISLYPKQREALRNTVEARFSLMVASRQIGKSTTMTILALWMALFKTDQNIFIVANKESTAIEIFKKIKLAYEELPVWLKSGVLKYNEKTLQLANGSSIQVSTTTGSALRGVTIDVLILDEFAFVGSSPGADRVFWASVYPTISASKSSKILIASTPYGTDNVFSDLYHGSVRGENKWRVCKILWSDVPGRDEAWVEDTKASLADPMAWRQEYECEFISTGASMNNEEFLKELQRNCREPEFVSGDGCYRIWHRPVQGHIYAAGVDTAEGIGMDSSVIQILDITDPRNIIQVAEYVNNRINPYEFTSKALEILEGWGKPIVLVERNSVGGQIADRLYNDHEYQDIVSFDGSRFTARPGCVCNVETKTTILRNMRYYMEEINVVTINSLKLIEELKTFNRNTNGTYSAKDGYHDDRVMSFAWALAALETAIASRYLDILSLDEHGKVQKLNTSSGRGAAQFFIQHDADIRPGGCFRHTQDEYLPYAGNPDPIKEMMAQGWMPLGGMHNQSTFSGQFVKSRFTGR